MKTKFSLLNFSKYKMFKIPGTSDLDGAVVLQFSVFS